MIAKYVERLLAASQDPADTLRRSAGPTGSRPCSPRNRMSEEPSPFCSIEEAIEEIRAGRMVVVVDSPDRENEGDLCMAAEYVSADADQLHGHARPRADLPHADARALRGARPADDGAAQPDAVRDGVHRLDRGPRGHRDGHLGQGSRAHHRGGLRDRRRGRATSSSRATSSRCARARAACSSARARPRPRSTSRGSPACAPAGVICEVMKADGTMARVPDLVGFCAAHGLKLCSVADLIEYRRRTERLVERQSSVRLPTPWGEFTAIGYRELVERQAAPRARARRRRRASRTCSCACTPSA